MTPRSSSTAFSRSFSRYRASGARSTAFKLIPHTALLLILGVIMAAPKYTLFALNHTPSMPEGFYVRAILTNRPSGRSSHSRRRQRSWIMPGVGDTRAKCHCWSSLWQPGPATTYA